MKPIIVGHGAFMERSLQDIKDLSCCGWLSGISLAEAYASSDILLFPSGVETFGNVTLEAQASGCVSIVEEKCSGHLVSSGENGFTCPDGDFEAYYQATKKLVVQTEMRKRFSITARESAWKFERTKIMRQMAENYKDAIVRHRDPTFIKRHLAQSPETEGRNVLAFLCGGCVGGDYCIVKAIAEPFLKSSVGAQNVYYGAQECVTTTRSRMSCGSLASMDYSSLENRPLNKKEEAEMQEQGKVKSFEGEKKGMCSGLMGFAANTCFSRWVTVITVVTSYIIIGILIHATVFMDVTGSK